MEQHGRRDVGWDLIPCSAGTGRGVDTLLPALQRSCPENGSSFPPPPSICIYMPQSSPASITVVLFCSEAVAFL